MAVGEQPGAKFRIGHVLHGELAAEREDGGGGGLLSQNHEYRLHPNRAVGDGGSQLLMGSGSTQMFRN